MDLDLAVAGISVYWIIAAIAGGFIGACVGGNYAFVFTGVSALFGLGYMVATKDSYVLDYIAFGPVFGPHVCFAGGAAASAYAAKRGYMEDGKDIVTPLSGLGKPDVWLVGSAFGVFGAILQKLVLMIPWFGHHTDSVAFTVFISAIVTRLMFGDSIFGSKPALQGFKPREGARWLEWQEKPSQFITLGVMWGMAFGGAALVLSHHFPVLAEAKNAQVFGFAISALCILILNLGHNVPVTHHMTITGGLAVTQFIPVLGLTPGHGVGLIYLLLGALGGLTGAVIGEVAARLFYDRGNTHIDPPAIAIWTTTTIFMAAAQIAGA